MKKFYLALPLREEPSRKFKGFIRDFGEYTYCSTRYWDNRLEFFATTDSVKKTSGINPSGLDVKTLSKFASCFNLCNSFEQKHREIKIVVSDPTEFALSLISSTSYNMAEIQKVLIVQITINDLPSEMVFSNFLELLEASK